MRSHNGQEIVLLKKLTACRVAEEVGTATHRVVGEEIATLLITKILQRIGPQQITHGPIGGWLPEAIQLPATEMKMKTKTKLTVDCKHFI